MKSYLGVIAIISILLARLHVQIQNQQRLLRRRQRQLRLRRSDLRNQPLWPRLIAPNMGVKPLFKAVQSLETWGTERCGGMNVLRNDLRCGSLRR